MQAGKPVTGIVEDAQPQMGGLETYDPLVDREETACISSLELASTHRNETSSTTPPTRRHTWAAKGRFNVSNVSLGW